MEEKIWVQLTQHQLNLLCQAEEEEKRSLAAGQGFADGLADGRWGRFSPRSSDEFYLVGYKDGHYSGLQDCMSAREVFAEYGELY